MRVIKLDARQWATIVDFYDALLQQLEAPQGHGRSIDALIDSMVYGSVNGVESPYRIWIVGTGGLSADLKREIGTTLDSVNAAQGTCGDIEFQIDP